jgi:uncharacterized protein
VPDTIVDTGRLAGRINARDQWHRGSVEIMEKLQPPLLTCDAAIVRLAEMFPRSKVVTTDTAHLTVYRRFRDKPLSLVHPGS